MFESILINMVNSLSTKTIICFKNNSNISLRLIKNNYVYLQIITINL